MTKDWVRAFNRAGFNPFGSLLGLKFVMVSDGTSECEVEVVPAHLNPHGVVHGGVLYSVADTGMGAALYPHLGEEESCATATITITYVTPATDGILRCRATLLNRGVGNANLEAMVEQDGLLRARANGRFSIFLKSRSR